jgi:(1->4)-alpha-D-glucan 1-alpha-D-glucosylmutase
MMHRASALRIDHVLGFYRLFIIPAGKPPSDGVYLRLPADAICNALAEESEAHRCLIIGEDLGTVPEDFPALLAAHNILSYRLLIFARDGDRFLEPHEYPQRALVSVSTHDLPPFLGFLEGSDVEARAALGIYRDEGERQHAHHERAGERQRLFDVLRQAGFEPGDNPVATLAAAHGFLARTPCTLLLVQMEDLALAREQPNMPGTDERHPNWRRKLPLDLHAIFAAPSTEVILGAVRKERPGRAPP